MKKIGIFYGSDTGNTEKVANIICNILTNKYSYCYDIINSSKKDFIKYNYLLLGIPTWYYGDPQCDWEEFIPILEKINFKNKYVAIFGCGDQEDYSEYFCDAIGYLYKIIKKFSAKIVGFWPNVGYKFESSKSLVNKNYFVGLPIDEDRQPHLTIKRVNKWIIKVLKEMKLK